jgi:tryptophan 2,3-dioxygenase
MTRPMVWDDDPACGHDVTCAYQTHYCTYIRVPRLLTLQSAQTPDELWLITAYQWYELWFKVLLADLRAALGDDGTTFEPVKLLRRGIELYKLFDLAADLSETVIVRELGLKKGVRAEEVAAVSEQFAELTRLARHLARLEHLPFNGLGQTVREYRARFRSFAARFEEFLLDTLEPLPQPSSVQQSATAYGQGREREAQTCMEWLYLSELLSLQNGVKAAWSEPGVEPTGLWQPESISPDENMFIVVHQCFELWFKVMLDQIDRAIPRLLRGEVTDALRLLQRVVLVQRLLVPQIQIPATMLPLDFMRFRHQTLERDGKVLATGLTPASGTESYQFREIELVSGLRDDAVFQKYLAGTDKLPIRLLTARQKERMQQATLPEAFRRAVERRGLDCFDALFTPADVPNPNADLAELADTLIQFDEFFQLWRLNHLGMVQKMIGAKSGTGFLGPEYLMETAGIKIQAQNRIFEERQVRPRFFQELWDVRTRMGAS